MFIINYQYLPGSCPFKQALKSGQLPADLDLGDSDSTSNKDSKEDKTVMDIENEANNGANNVSNEQKENGVEMEQVKHLHPDITFPAVDSSYIY